MIATSYNNPCKLSVRAGRDTYRILWYFTLEFQNLKYLHYKFSGVSKNFF